MRSYSFIAFHVIRIDNLLGLQIDPFHVHKKDIVNPSKVESVCMDNNQKSEIPSVVTYSFSL